MVSFSAIGAAAFIHALLGVTFYLPQAIDMCSPAPPLASLIFIAGILMLAAKIDIYPERYNHLPYTIEFLVDTVLTLALLEISSLIVWCNLERMIYSILRSLLPEEMNLSLEYVLLGLTTSGLACLLFYVMKCVVVPDGFDFSQFFPRTETVVQLNPEFYAQMLHEYERSNRRRERVNRRRR